MNNILLYITWNPDLTAFHLGPLSFRWYSLCWLIGLALAYFTVRWLYKDQKIDDRKFDPLFFYCFIGILVGARLGHCIFYQPEDYLTSVKGFIEMWLPIQFTGYDDWDFKVTGYEGLASHGGTLGLMLALWLYVKRYKMPVWQVLDNIAIATGITACCIRLGNLMNSEIIGNVTSMPWGFYFVNAHPATMGTEPRHPAQLYEAIAYLLLFLLMVWLYKREKSQATLNAQHSTKIGTGFYFGLCLTYIFTFRFFVEFLKINQVDFENSLPLDMGQLLSIPFVILGVWCMRRSLRKAAVILIILLVPNTSFAQSLYEQNIRLGEMFQQSGCLTQAEQYYQTALSQVAPNDRQQWLNARLHTIDLLKFWQPIEAQNLNNEIINDCKAWPELYQKSLFINASISFWMNDKINFNRVNDEYLELCRQHEELPTTYDKPLQAMNEALNGYYDEALRTIDQNIPGTMMRHEMRLRIFQMKGNDKAIINELKQRAATIDSLSAATYTANLNEVAATYNMTLAQQKAERRSSHMLQLTLIMALIIILMFGLWIYLHRRNQKNLEKKNEQLSTALKMANETEQMKSEFVKRVSHEIRTPLNAITGFNEILNNPDIPLEQGERKDLLDRISENVKAITGIVDELLQVANTESMQDYAHHDIVLCNQFLSDLIYGHRKEVSADVELRYTTKTVNRFSIETNKEMLEKIVEHLLGNAIKFTKQGYIELNCAQKNGNVIITITDTGCGIPADKQDEVFEQFAKADAFRQGIGLGLTVSRKMAQKMGGDLKLDKTYTSGARFILTLPIE